MQYHLGRCYRCLFPVPGPAPDFHKLDSFGELDADLAKEFPKESSDLWLRTETLKN